MVPQGLRDRETLRVNYPLADKKLPGGETNPATQQIDFYIRSPQQNPKNRSARQVFMHFFGMEITWKQARLAPLIPGMLRDVPWLWLQGAGHRPYRRRRAGSVQFSSRRFGTRSNSAVLFVTNVSPSAKAWAAMNRSLAPIITPRRFKSARISA